METLRLLRPFIAPLEVLALIQMNMAMKGLAPLLVGFTNLTAIVGFVVFFWVFMLVTR